MLTDAPTAVLDRVPVDDLPPWPVAVVDFDDLPTWPIIDRDPPPMPGDRRLIARPSIPTRMPGRWAPVTVGLLERVLSGLRRLL